MLTTAISAREVGSTLPYLHRNWARPSHISTGTGVHPCPHLHQDRACPVPHLHRDWGSPRPHLHRDWARQVCILPGPPGALPSAREGAFTARLHLRRDWAHPAHICAGTELTPPTSAPGLRSPRPHLRQDLAGQMVLRASFVTPGAMGLWVLDTPMCVCAHARGRMDPLGACVRVCVRACVRACVCSFCATGARQEQAARGPNSQRQRLASPVRLLFSFQRLTHRRPHGPSFTRRPRPAPASHRQRLRVRRGPFSPLRIAWP
jgi:hypothetical protein